MFRYTKHYNDNILHYYCCITTKIIFHKTLTFLVFHCVTNSYLNLVQSRAFIFDEHLITLLFTNISTWYLFIVTHSNVPTLNLCKYNTQHLTAFRCLLCYSCQTDTSGFPIQLSHKFKSWYPKHMKNWEIQKPPLRCQVWRQNKKYYSTYFSMGFHAGANLRFLVSKRNPPTHSFILLINFWFQILGAFFATHRG
jgi:hypothetical protein